MPTLNNTTYCIYRIVCVATGSVYVGQTNNPKARKSKHFKNLIAGTHYNEHLQRSFSKYGSNSFYFEILESDISRDDIDQREIYWISHFDSYHNGYNLTNGGKDGSRSGSECFWNGIKYESLTDAGRAIGVSHQTMLRRVAAGWACDADIKPENSKSVFYNGVLYPSIRAASRSTGLSISTLYRHIRSPQKPNTAPKPQRPKRTTLTEDQVIAIRKEYAYGHTTSEALANKYGVSRSAILSVINRDSWKLI